jgi:UDP-2,3-diacylglucosamine hydrolase
VNASPEAADAPAPPTLSAPVAWHTIDFISDLHLAPDTPKGVQAWADYLNSTTADAVFILGDLFEAWVGDDSRHEGFEADCAGVLVRATSNRAIAFMAGNRDFLIGDAMLQACGMLRLQDPTVLSAFGQRVLLAHGDAWCTGDIAYQQFRRQVRNPAWQAQVLAKSLAERRLYASHMRSESERQMASNTGDWFDVDSATALRFMTDAQTPTLIHGHTHRPGSDALAPGFVRHVLSDWELDHAAHLRAEVLRWKGGEFERITLGEARAAA